jgi:hypothetical protein
MGPIEEHLRNMRELLSGPERWTQLASARDEHGWEVDLDCYADIDDPAPVCWCLSGASEYLGWNDAAVEFLQHSIATDNIPAWNDAPDRTFPEVADALDRSIALAAKRGV